MSRRLLLLFHTVRYLRWEQVVYRLYYRFARARIRIRDIPRLRDSFPRVLANDFVRRSFLAPDRFSFLGEERTVSLRDWAAGQSSMLWRYNLHYFDDLNATGAAEHIAEHRQLVHSWIVACLPLTDVGWAPYPLSLRIVNWIKWLSRNRDQATDEVLASLAQQVDVLAQRLEFHLLGNHLFENAKALVFGGTYFIGRDAERWRTIGLRLLDRELQEQFLPDGGHFERSPMYQATMLSGILDLLELGMHSSASELASRYEAWQHLFERGLRWLDTMSFPDGEIAFFNDATFGIAPKADGLRQRAKQLGIAVAGREPSPTAFATVDDLPDTGYARVAWSDAVLIVDMAPIGPDYLPGHAHADTLSFELAVGENRLFVNSGTSCYGGGPERERQRGTAAHNTVEVDGADSSEVWGGFRVARRARPVSRSVMPTSEGAVLKCSHTGYRRLPGKVLHTRRWQCGRSSLTIEDRLDGRFHKARSLLLVHPDWHAELLGNDCATLRHASGRVVRVVAEHGQMSAEPATWHPGFGQSVATIRLVTAFQSQAVAHRIAW